MGVHDMTLLVSLNTHAHSCREEVYRGMATTKLPYKALHLKGSCAALRKIEELGLWQNRGKKRRLSMK